MKRCLPLLLALCLAFSLAACGSEEEPAAGQSQPVSSQAEASQPEVSQPDASQPEEPQEEPAPPSATARRRRPVRPPWTTTPGRCLRSWT